MSIQPAEQAVERFVPDKKEFLKLIVSGKSISKIERSWNLNAGSLHYWVGKWSLKGIKPERAQQLLDEMVIDGEAPAPKTGLISLNEQIKQEDAASGPLTSDKDAEIADLNRRLKRAIDRIETMTETTNDTLGRNSALKEKVAQLESLNANTVALSGDASDEHLAEIERLREELANSLGQRNVFLRDLDEAQKNIEELESDRQVLLATIEQASKAEEIAPAPRLSGRSLHTELNAPTEQIVDELAALISYIRSGNGKAFYLDLQLNEVTG